MQPRIIVQTLIDNGDDRGFAAFQPVQKEYIFPDVYADYPKLLMPPQRFLATSFTTQDDAWFYIPKNKEVRYVVPVNHPVNGWVEELHWESFDIRGCIWVVGLSPYHFDWHFDIYNARGRIAKFVSFLKLLGFKWIEHETRAHDTLKQLRPELLNSYQYIDKCPSVFSNGHTRYIDLRDLVKLLPPRQSCRWCQKRVKPYTFERIGRFILHNECQKPYWSYVTKQEDEKRRQLKWLRKGKKDLMKARKHLRTHSQEIQNF
jgi:hypothetical protein